MSFISEAIRSTHESTNVASFGANYLSSYAIGTGIVLAVNAPVTAALTGFSASDSAGNTYTQLVLENTTPVNYQCALLFCKLTAAVTTATTLTVTASGGNPAKWCVLAEAFNDISGVDTGVVAHTSGSGTAVAVGPTPTASQNSELIFSAAAYTDTATPLTVTKGAGFTDQTPLQTSASSSPRSLHVQWQYVNAAGTRSSSRTLSSSQGWGSTIAAFKVTTVPHSTDYFVGPGNVLIPMRTQIVA